MVNLTEGIWAHNESEMVLKIRLAQWGFSLDATLMIRSISCPIEDAFVLPTTALT